MQIEPGDDLNLDLELKTRSGILDVSCNVDGATVQLNGEEIGHTPLQNIEVSEGHYDLVVEKEGYSKFSKSIQIQNSRTLKLNLNLKEERKNVRSEEVFIRQAQDFANHEEYSDLIEYSRKWLLSNPPNMASGLYFLGFGFLRAVQYKNASDSLYGLRR